MSLRIVNLSKTYAVRRARRLVDDDDLELTEDEDSEDVEPSELPVPSGRLVLRRINVAIEPGEKVGIIGINGAGKSTLLNIIAGITLPSEGYVQGKGRRVLLNSIGSPFRGDLSGRKNLHILAQLLGVSIERLEERLPDIVAFSGLADVVDQRVKTYSKNQYARLSFAAAMMLDPSIILSDDILGVGDAIYQQRCENLISEKAATDEVTFILASNKLRRVEEFCSRAIWLENGVVAADGPVEEVIEAFLDRTELDNATDLENENDTTIGISPSLSTANSSDEKQFSSAEPEKVDHQLSGKACATRNETNEWNELAKNVLLKEFSSIETRQLKLIGTGKQAISLEVGGRKERWEGGQLEIGVGNEIEGIGKISKIQLDLNYTNPEIQYSIFTIEVETFIPDVELHASIHGYWLGTHVFTSAVPQNLKATRKGCYAFSVEIPNVILWPRIPTERGYQKVKLIGRVYMRKSGEQWWASTIGRARLQLFGLRWSPPIPQTAGYQEALLFPPLQWQVEFGAPRIAPKSLIMEDYSSKG